MRRARFVTIFSLCLFVAASVAACRTNEYELELQPDGDTMQRKVSLSAYTYQDGVKTYAEVDTGTLQYISQGYDAPMPTDLAQRHEFEGTFQRRLPADIGDGGWYLRQASTMGSVNVYAEHVDGDRKIIWDLDTRQINLHRLVDVWLVWLDSEFGDDERYPPFREFVDEVIRDDLWNISIYLWGYEMFGSVGANASVGRDEMELATDVLFRIAIYLAERDYFDPEQLPGLVQRVLTTIDEAEWPNLVWSFMLRGAATKLGIAPDEPLPWPLTEFDEDPEVFIESVDLFVAESAELQAMAEAWKQEYWDSLSPSEYANRKEMDQLLSEIAPEQSGPVDSYVLEDFLDVEVPPYNYVSPDDNESMLSELVEMAFPSTIIDFSFGATTTRLQVILHVPREPLATNGNWQKDGTVRWNDNIDLEGSWGDRLPDVFHAIWAAPDVEFQETHFGKVVLDGEELVEHVGWYLALSPELIQEWGDFLTELKPGPELIPKLQNFCFSSERCNIADDTLREIVDALVPEPESSDEKEDK